MSRLKQCFSLAIAVSIFIPLQPAHAKHFGDIVDSVLTNIGRAKTAAGLVHGSGAGTVTPAAPPPIPVQTQVTGTVVTPPAPAPVQPQPQPVSPTPSATVLPGTGYNTNQYFNQYHRPYQTQPTRTIVIVRGQPTRVVKVGRAPARQEHAAPAPQQIVPPVATKFDPVPSQKKPDATKPVAANTEVKTFQTDWVDKVLVMLQSKI